VPGYERLLLRFDPLDGAQGYAVYCEGPAGEARETFELPFGAQEVERFALRMTRSRHIGAAAGEAFRAEEIGARLFSAVFAGSVRDVYRASLAEARGNERGLRVTLQLSRVPELMGVPWEYLYDEPDFLVTSEWTPVVRYLDVARPRRALAVEPPLRVLGMVSDPSDLAALDVEGERQRLATALEPLTRARAVEVEWCEPKLTALLQRLRAGEFHVFHYIGHGAFDPAQGDGVLLLEGDEGRSAPVTGTLLGGTLRDHASLRLAVLNSCEGARSSAEDPFAGVAASLVRREMPAVVAMQFEITDQAALTFAGSFYEGLAAGEPVDAAVTRARREIFAAGSELEWGTPVLFMRASDGLIFDVPDGPGSGNWFPGFPAWMLWGVLTAGLYAFVGFLSAAAAIGDRRLRNWGLGYALATALVLVYGWIVVTGTSAVATAALVALWVTTTLHAIGVGGRARRMGPPQGGEGEEWFPAFAPWMLWPLLSLGTLAGIGFLRVAARTGDQRLRNWGLAYTVLGLAVIVGVTITPERVGFLLFTTLLIVTVAHAFAVGPRVSSPRA
jgi:hypothetical protein